MVRKLRFGVLSTANIGLKKVIPAMQQGKLTTVTAIASRDLAKAREAAKSLGIPTAYGSYEELLADPNIDAIYNPLPNQLHVPWTTKAAEAGKHVLCEKPLSMTVAEAKTLLDVRARTGVKICEAFMIRSAHQWLRVRELLDEGRIGELRAVNAHFSYFNVNPANIRNQVETGGGGVYDIGCYCIQAARFAFGQSRRAWSPPSTAIRSWAPTGWPRRFSISRRPRHLHLQHAIDPLPARPLSRHARPHRNRDSLSTRPTTGPRASSSTRPATYFQRHRNRDLPHRRSVHAAGRRLRESCSRKYRGARAA